MASAKANAVRSRQCYTISCRILQLNCSVTKALQVRRPTYVCTVLVDTNFRRSCPGQQRKCKLPRPLACSRSMKG